MSLTIYFQVCWLLLLFQFHPNHLLLLKVSQIVGPPTFLHSVSPMSDRKSEVFANSGVGLFTFSVYYQERIQDFKLGGAHLKKLHRAERDEIFLGFFM